MKELFEDLKFMNRKTRFKEALRHFHDALYIRNVRLDIACNKTKKTKKKFCFLILVKSTKTVKFFYFITTNPIWQNLLSLISWIYVFLAFFEPINRYDYDHLHSKKNYEILIGGEIIILIFFMADNAMEIAHRRVSKSSFTAYVLGLIRNKKLFFKTLLNFLFITDFLSFYINYPTTPFRYSRYFRPCNIFFLFFSLSRLNKNLSYEHFFLKRDEKNL